MEKIAVLGVGKLGLCLALHLENAGYDVTGVDINEEYVKALNGKSFSTHEKGVNEFLYRSKRFTATTKITEILDPGIRVIFLMVATPTSPEGGYDHQQVERVTDQLIKLGKRADEIHLVVGCTTMPGYCDQLAAKMASFNYLVSYNPEFIAQGRIMKDLVNPDQVLIGEANTDAGDIIASIYRKICKNSPAIHRMDRLSAEICKLATNCFLTTKISFANSIGDLALKAGADPDKILKAIGSDSRIGSKYLGYGFGFGGPCFPRDNRALGLYADKQSYKLLISKATDEVNRQHLEFQLHKLLKTHPEESVIEFDYVTYKKDSLILEESQQLALAAGLAKAGRKVRIKEREMVIQEVEKLYPGLFQFEVWE